MIAQGSVDFNEGYGDNVVVRIDLAKDCNQIQRIASQSIASLNATLASVTSQLNGIQAEAALVVDDFTKLYSHIATIAGCQAAHSAVVTQAATAPSVIDLGTAIAYIQAQAAVTLTLNESSLLKLAAEALSLYSEYNRLQTDYGILQSKITTLEAQITAIPAAIARITTGLENAASRFEGCVIST